MNNIIRRNQAQGNVQGRKVIGVEKSPLLNKSTTTEVSNEQKEVVEVNVKENPSTPPSSTPSDLEVKRAEFSALEKSRKLAAKAKEDLKRAEELSAAYDSGDLERIAKANNMGVNDYVRWVNAKALGAPTDKIPSSKERIEKNAEDWQEAASKRINRLEQKAADADKYSYINKNILPHIIKDTEKFEMVVDHGVDEVCSKVYDFMNQHFLETGGEQGGEELDPLDLLSGLEEEYRNEWLEEEKAREEKRKKFKHLQQTDQQLKPQDEQTNQNEANSSATNTPKTIGAVKSPSSTPKTSDDILAATLSNEDALAQSAPSNLVAGPSRGSTAQAKPRINMASSFQTGGTTPKNSPLSRESRLARLSNK